jgi:hypothetical protein
MTDDRRTLLLRLGQAQIDGMFARQDEGPAIDDSEFLPLVEVVLTAFEKTQGDDFGATKLWKTIVMRMASRFRQRTSKSE